MRLTHFLVAGCLVACSPNGRNNTGQPDATASDTGSASGDVAPPIDDSKVYAHSGKVLYRLDTTTLVPTMIGNLTGLVGNESLTDLAIDNQNHMLGVSLDNLYTIDAATGAATLIGTIKVNGTMAGFTSLSFVPNPAGSGDDILVSANGQGDVYQIDTTTAMTTKIGNFGTRGADKITSSGDLFGVVNFGVYATVKVGTDPNDYLVKVDPTQNWKATLPANDTGVADIFGLGFWGGKIYGFVNVGVDSGKIVQLDAVTGQGSMTKTGAIRWYGAGVQTNAPIIQ